MRYSDDVINAESWNPDLKKSVLPANPDSGETSGEQNNTTPKKIVPPAVHLSAPPENKPAAEPIQASNPALLRIAKLNPTPAGIRPSKSRISKRKKGWMFLLSGLLTGLVPRSRDEK